MLNMLEKTLNRNLLKYSAGQHMFCPRCGNVADYRKWVIVDDEDGKTVWQGCTDCAGTTFDNMPGYTVIRESMPKEKRQPKFNNTIDIRSKDGESIEVQCVKAFDMFGHSFYAHLMINNPKEWAITHAKTGAAITLCHKSKTAAIRTAKFKLESIGEDGFNKALERITPC